MKTVKVQPNQNVFDLAVQHYGTVEAVDEILRLNPDLKNEASALDALDINTAGNEVVFQLDAAVKAGFPLKIDETSKNIKKNILKKINQDITTYENKKS